MSTSFNRASTRAVERYVALSEVLEEVRELASHAAPDAPCVQIFTENIQLCADLWELLSFEEKTEVEGLVDLSRHQWTWDWEDLPF